MKFLFTIEVPDTIAEESLAAFALCHGWRPVLEQGESVTPNPVTAVDAAKAILIKFVVDSIKSVKSQQAQEQAKILVEQATKDLDTLATVTLEVKE